MSTRTLLRLASALVLISSGSAAVLGWLGLATIEVSGELAPGFVNAVPTSLRLIAAADDTLDGARAGLSAFSSVSDRVSESAPQIADAVDEIADLTQNRIPDTLAAVESSMPALIGTAAVIDDTARALSVLGVPYNPTVPLDEALADVRDQLSGLPDAIEEQGESLRSLGPEIRQSGADTAQLSEHIDAIDVSLADAQVALGDYRLTVGSLSETATASTALAGAVPIGRVTVVLLALAGVGLAVAGLVPLDPAAGPHGVITPDNGVWRDGFALSFPGSNPG